MTQYQNFQDTPDGIIKEGQEVVLKFTRNGDGTATITWTIPSPVNGCTAATQAYDGILITIDTKPANYRSTSPMNGKMYTGDLTANSDIHAGDKIDTALVAAAFYHDKTTTSITITDVNPSIFYYVSGYAVDNVGTYHREGVHAYSLPTGESENPVKLYNAYQDIGLVPPDIKTITLNTLTGLDKTQTYNLQLTIDNVDYTISVLGSEAQTYNDLINSINLGFKTMVGNPFNSPIPPNANTYYIDLVNSLLYLWDGYKNVPQTVVFFDQDISVKPTGTYWANPLDLTSIKKYENATWVTQPFINANIDPTKPACGKLWVTGTSAGSSVFEFDGDYWMQLPPLISQSRNPLLSPILDCSTYWYDTTNSLLYKWNIDSESFEEILAIISNKDPNTLTTGDFWLDETNGYMYRYVGGSWNLLTNVRYDAPDANGNLSAPMENSYWLNPSTQVFYKRDSTNTVWAEVDYTMYPSDPLARSSGDIWWNQTPSVDSLFVWDIVNSKWKNIINFLQQATDPSLPPNLGPCVVWYNTTDGTINYITKSGCTDKDPINFPYDPTNPPIGTVWYNPSVRSYSAWDGANWIQISPIISTYDPFTLDTTKFWYNSSAKVLNQWNGSSWTVVKASTVSLVPLVDSLWFNTVSNNLYTWNGTWVDAIPVASVSLKYQISRDSTINGRAYLLFLHNTAGCDHYIEIVPSADGLLSKLAQSVIYCDPMLGGNGPASGPMYKQLDVGTDGTPDERRTLQATIRTLLGNIGVQVELTKAQIDQAIDNALLQFRRYSSYAYTRNFFFLDAKPNQQTYVLSNKCVGFNKITSIKAIYRMQAGWIRTGFSGNELFGVAALQQLYTVGTFDMLSFGMLSMYMKELEQMFASRIMHQWVESSRELRLFQRIVLPERLLLDATMERTEQDLITNRASAMWIQSWALAEAKMMLSQVRGKYTTLPGPNGSTSLNASDLATQADSEKTALMEELFDPAMGNLEDVGLSAHLTIG